MANVALILSGCGVFDGSEIHEAVLSMLYLEKGGAEVQCFAPDKPQAQVINHLTQEPMTQERNVLVESARIARGNIKPITELNVADFDAVVFPGGYGAAKNLCTFAVDGANCNIDPDVSAAIRQAYAQKKVIGAICISPVTVARALKDDGVKSIMTIGSDAATAGALRDLGSENQPATVTDIAVDEDNRIVSTPAYMLGPNIANVAQGIEKCMNKVLELAK